MNKELFYVFCKNKILYFVSRKINWIMRDFGFFKWILEGSENINENKRCCLRFDFEKM